MGGTVQVCVIVLPKHVKLRGRWDVNTPQHTQLRSNVCQWKRHAAFPLRATQWGTTYHMQDCLYAVELWYKMCRLQRICISH